MKKRCLALTMLFFALQGCAQQINPTGNSNTEVKVSDWNKKIFLFPDDYWENKTEQIEKQIGKDEFNRVKIYSITKNVPDEMEIFSKGKLADTAVLNKALNQLHVYKIATYTHFSNDGINRGDYAILRVPYTENKTWNSNSKWDTVYFIIPVEYLKPLH